MGSTLPTSDLLPSASSPSLHLTHPTPLERTATWTLNSRNWGGALGLESYIERETYLMNVPLARDGGITHWILTSSSAPPSSRPILASCESLRKPALVRTPEGEIKELITHGIGSVFCDPQYRGRGYASRMLKELGKELKTWQVGEGKECLFSILYSDIGKKYYAGLGWAAFPSTHIAFPPSSSSSPKTGNIATPLTYPDLPSLCALDEKYIRDELANAKGGKVQVALLPNYDTMQWHHHREDFVTKKLFGHSPTVKGAIAGSPGSRVWAIWTRNFYGPLDSQSSHNTFHILRVVIEDKSASAAAANVGKLRSIIERAQDEAREWKLGHVEMWNPTPYAKGLIEKLGIEYKEVDREEESIASLMWYGAGNGGTDEIEWVANEKFGWC
ncbi:hypothetical protein M430DRAFT_53397 [Amorphotheca resinae ATCC 22711]|uniref:LYC1 C-terminal domain-containing protein n=1 Tax=Amorphotheca resinae ATCC 22711 TaxID=857342 RepID=A0A2T3ATR9_AMORE|nr:hypothetical protein M430DRAFT_53397 [Amorphotheca resinae ATCC 22711]PSS10851.1 hypothetical protein M430DRAFT_53397 [Amorphotheca resinae ATCC 22711]